MFEIIQNGGDATFSLNKLLSRVTNYSFNMIFCRTFLVVTFAIVITLPFHQDSSFFSGVMIVVLKPWRDVEVRN